MSTEQNNIQAAQSGYAAFGRGDMAGVLAVLDESVEWKTPGMADVMAHTGTKNGHAGVLEFFGSVAETWEFQTFEPREYIASGDQVAVRGHYRAKSRKTGRVAESDWVMIWRFRNGKCTHFQEYTDTAALRDALTARASA
jgi:uncharacterized protein